METYKEILKDIKKEKNKLIKKAAKSGIYENFWQDEVRKLEDKYSDYRYKEEFDLIITFSDWCANYTN